MTEPAAPSDISPDIAYLAGISVDDSDERLSCRAICHFLTEAGVGFEVPLGTVIESLRFAGEQNILPALPLDWYWLTDWKHGCSV